MRTITTGSMAALWVAAAVVTSLPMLVKSAGQIPGSSGPYNYLLLGEDWKHRPDSWCGSTEQSPIDLEAPSERGSYAKFPMVFAPTFELPSVHYVRIQNNGHNINLEFTPAPGVTVQYPAGKTFTALNGPYTGSGRTRHESIHEKESFDNSGENVPAKIQATITDVHWHIPSEHAIGGKLFAAEGHFVHQVVRPEDPDCAYEGYKCLVVVAVMYDLVYDGKEGNDGLSEAIKSVARLPKVNESEVGNFSSVNLQSFLPESKAFWSYRGSLTTPECDENVTWYVLKQHMYMGWTEFTELQHAFLYEELGDLNARPPQPLNKRIVFDSDRDNLRDSLLDDVGGLIGKANGSDSTPLSIATASVIAALLLSLVFATVVK